MTKEYGLDITQAQNEFYNGELLEKTARYLFVMVKTGVIQVQEAVKSFNSFADGYYEIYGRKETKINMKVMFENLFLEEGEKQEIAFKIYGMDKITVWF